MSVHVLDENLTIDFLKIVYVLKIPKHKRINVNTFLWGFVFSSFF